MVILIIAMDDTAVYALIRTSLFHRNVFQISYNFWVAQGRCKILSALFWMAVHLRLFVATHASEDIGDG